MKKHVPLLLNLLSVMGLLVWSATTRAQCSLENEILDLPITDGSAIDLSPQSQTLTMNGNAGYAAGQDGDETGAISLAGASDFVTISADPSMIQMSDSFTVAMWVYPTSFSPFNTFMSKVNGNNRNIVFRCQADGRVQVHFTGSSSLVFVTTDDPHIENVNQWYHVAATWNGDDMKIFVNGVLVKNQTLSESPSFQASGDMLLGALVGSERLTGRVDDVQIRSFAVEDEQIACLMNTPIEQGLVLSLPLNGNATDVSTYGNNGIINNGVVSAENRFMEPASSMSFTGSTGITVANQSQYNGLASGFSISAWIKPSSVSGVQTIVAKTGNQRDIALRVQNGKFVVHYFLNGYTFFTPANATVVANEWTHVACSWDGTTMRLFQDGVEIYSDQPTITPVFNPSNDWTVGVISTAGFEVFQGLIDDVLVWDRVLAPCEFAKNMQPNIDIVVEDNLLMCPEQSQTVTASEELCSYLWTADNSTEQSFEIDASVLGSGEHQIVVRAYDYYDRLYTDTVNVTVTVGGATYNTQNVEICDGESITIGSNSYNSSGSYTDILINSNGCDSVLTTNVTVNPLPQPDLGNDVSICSNQSVTLSPESVSYTSYDWSNSSSGSTIIVDNNSSGVGTHEFWVEVEDANGCVNSDTLNVTIAATTSHSQSVEICEGESITIGSNSYTASGNYTDVLVNSSGCDPVLTTTITVNPLPQPDLGNDVSICSTETATLSPGSVSYTNYSWSNSSSGSTIIVNSSSGLGTNEFWVEVEDANGCINSDSINVTINVCTGIEETNESNPMKLFPNPATDVVIVSAVELSQIQLLDVSGRLLQTTTVVGTDKTVLDISKVPSGIYYIEGVQNDGTIYTERLMKH